MCFMVMSASVENSGRQVIKCQTPVLYFPQVIIGS